MRGIILGWLMAATLALSGCANPTPSGAIRTAAAPADQCEKYRGDATTFARCQLFTSPLGADLIPAAGRSAELEAQLRCAKFRRSLEPYEACIGIAPSPAEPDISVAHSAPGAVEVSRLEPTSGEGAARDLRPRTHTVARTVEWPRTDAARTLEQDRLHAPSGAQALGQARALTRTQFLEQTRTIAARTNERAEIAPKREQPSRYLPKCAENGSCYGDISSDTGRPKTAHVSGYYRKDGTYVRGHYRSRPLR
jgi:hypothetical protein